MTNTRSTRTLHDGWRMVRLDEVAQVNPRRPRLSLDPETLVTFLPMAAVSEDCSGIVTPLQRPYQEISKGYTYFQKNDILFAKITPCLQNGKHALATGLHNGFGFGTTEFHVLRARACIDPRHLFRVVTQAVNIEKFANSFTGTAGQQRVQPEVLKSLRFHLPPLAEQLAIAEVLDAIDDGIQRMGEVISATERLREALLQELLTKGLPGWHTEWQEHPNLGTIPADWQVVRLGDISERPKYGATAPALPREHGGPRYVRITDITNDGRLRRTDARSADPSKVKGYELEKGDLLFARSGSVGRTYLYREVDGPCTYAGYLIRFRPRLDMILPQFVSEFTHSQSYMRWTRAMRRVGAQPNINASEYSDLRIPLPKLKEQATIIEVLNSINDVIESTRMQAESLATFKDSMTDILLRGRLRVRKEGPS